MKVRDILAKSRSGYRGDNPAIVEARRRLEAARAELRRLVRAQGGSLTGDRPRKGFAALGREAACAAALRRWHKGGAGASSSTKHNEEITHDERNRI